MADAPSEQIELILSELLDQLVAMLPNARARRSLHREKKNAPLSAAGWIQVNGLGNWLASLIQAFAYPRDWWGVPGFASIVAEFEALSPGPPDPATFRDRLVNKPWELSDEQAEFVCDHRYDVGRSEN
ncbi:MAG: hypothetical protein ACT4P1_17155 [Sporichthyaceae bacterium]